MSGDGKAAVAAAPAPAPAPASSRVARTSLRVLAALATAFVVSSLVGRSAHLGVAFPPEFRRPDWRDRAGVARWLVHSSDWAALATLDASSDGSTPYASVVSIADAPRGASSPRVFTYLTPLDEAASDAASRPAVSLLVTAAALEGGCARDPEDPTCARVTVLGDLEQATGEAAEAAKAALFPRHPEMQRWPKGHNFTFYEVAIRRVDVLNFFGGRAELSLAEYANVTLVPVWRHHCRRHLGP